RAVRQACAQMRCKLRHDACAYCFASGLAGRAVSLSGHAPNRGNATDAECRAKLLMDHIHLRSPDPEATAAWFERILGAQVIRSTVEGKPRIDLKLGGADVFIMPVAPGDKVNPPPMTPYQGLDHFGLTVSGIDAVAADLKARGVEFTMEPRTIRP